MKKNEKFKIPKNPIEDLGLKMFFTNPEIKKDFNIWRTLGGYRIHMKSGNVFLPTTFLSVSLREEPSCYCIKTRKWELTLFKKSKSFFLTINQ